MTAKRFTITQDFEEHHRQIRDNGHIIMGCFLEPQAEPIVKLLNELHEENKKLKQVNEMLQMDFAMTERNLIEENDQLKFENNELKCALALDEVEYIIADGKKIDIPPYYEFEQRYDSVMHRREYDGYD